MTTPLAGSISGTLLDRVASMASAVDCDPHADRRPLLRALADEGVLDLGLPGSSGTYVDQTRVLAELAGVCMTTAFSAWAHRMTTEYLARWAGPDLETTAGRIRTGIRPGSTALAATFRAATGQGDLTVELTQRGSDGFTANGPIAWASNLYDDAVVVTGAKSGNSRCIVAFETGRPGVSIAPAHGLLALDASKSGGLLLDTVEIRKIDVLPVSFDTFVGTVRPIFLAFQTSFCLGLAAASLSAAGEPSGVAASLTAPLSERREELARLGRDLEDLARWLDDRVGDAPVHPVRLRLEAAHLAAAATQLELAIQGGRAFQAKSPTARRVREALFLPVQSPTEAQLQWELQRSS